MILQIPIFKQLKETLFNTDNFQVRRLVVESGQSVPWHFHSQCIDLIIPISGQAVLHLENDKTVLKEHTCYLIENNQNHSIENIGNDAFYYLLYQYGRYDFIPSDKTKFST